MNDDILRKIKRCMDLSKSSNEYEAAMALKQMQALMSKHGYNAQNVKAADVKEAEFELNVKKPAQWILSLHSTIAQAMDCESMAAGGRGIWDLDLFFVGVDSSPEIANYAFEVLYRKLKAARANYIKQHLFRYKRSNKTKLADAYCQGWVSNVYQKVKNLNPNIEAFDKIKAYKETKIHNYDPKNVIKGRTRFNRTDTNAKLAMNHGYSESKDVNLYAAASHQEIIKLGEATL